GMEGQQRRCARSELGVDLGGDLLGLGASRADLAADGLAALAVVEPPRSVVLVERHPTDPDALRRTLLAARHGTRSCARFVHQASARRCSQRGPESAYLLDVAYLTPTGRGSTAEREGFSYERPTGRAAFALWSASTTIARAYGTRSSVPSGPT